MRPVRLILLLPLVLLAAETPCRSEGDRAPSPDEQILKQARLPADASFVLQFLHQRAQLLSNPARLEALVHRLQNGVARTRDEAQAELVACGARVLPLLRQALKDPDDAETLQRARQCVEAIDNPAVTTAVIRRLAELRPSGASAALLAYAPFADDSAAVEEIQFALTSIALPGGKPDEVIQKALADPVPIRRSLAAAALCRAGGLKQARLVEPLLEDAKPTVRVRAALALATVHDAAAVPALIAGLSDAPLEEARQADQFLHGLAGDQAPSPALGETLVSRLRCRTAWMLWWKSVDSSALLGYFRKRTASDQEQERLEKLVNQLGDDSFEVRERASAAIARLGPLAVARLQKAAASGDAEIARRARDSLGRLETKHTGMNAVIAARLLAFRRPPGMVEALLGYVPVAPEEAQKAIQEALDAAAEVDGVARKSLEDALPAAAPARRTAAALALARAGERDKLHPLLKDRDPRVRLRVALALAGQSDRQAVPALIDLIAELPAEAAAPAHDFLTTLAGDSAPGEAPGEDAEARRQNRQAWASWWQMRGNAMDMDRTSKHRALGRTLVTEIFARNFHDGRVIELDRHGKIRWQISGLRFPADAQVLPGERVLICETNAMQVTERDLHGKVLWRYPVTMPVNCQRLPNGHLFIACRNQFLELDHQRHEILRLSRPAHDVLAARELPDGHIICLTMTGLCQRTDRSGKVEKQFQIGPSQLGGLEVLPGGHVLVAQVQSNRVAEFDQQGHLVWQAQALLPSSATRLPDGNTLVASRQPSHVVELDRSGRVVWEYKSEGQPLRARRR